jgi:hypothetical protein
LAWDALQHRTFEPIDLSAWLYWPKAS